jgi:hypothetical protein
MGSQGVARLESGARAAYVVMGAGAVCVLALALGLLGPVTEDAFLILGGGAVAATVITCGAIVLSHVAVDESRGGAGGVPHRRRPRRGSGSSSAIFRAPRPCRISSLSGYVIIGMVSRRARPPSGNSRRRWNARRGHRVALWRFA